MIIIQKEMINLSQEEINALSLTLRICSGIERESNNPELRKLANETYLKICDLWNMGEFGE